MKASPIPSKHSIPPDAGGGLLEKIRGLFARSLLLLLSRKEKPRPEPEQDPRIAACGPAPRLPVPDPGTTQPALLKAASPRLPPAPRMPEEPRAQNQAKKKPTPPPPPEMDGEEPTSQTYRRPSPSPGKPEITFTPNGDRAGITRTSVLPLDSTREILTNTPQPTADATPGKLTLPALPSSEAPDGLVEQAFDKIHRSLQSGRRTVTIKLEPPELGQMKVVFSYRDGKLHLQMSCSQTESYLHLRQEIGRLEQRLVQAGIDHAGIDLTHQDAAGRQPGDPGPDSPRADSNRPPAGPSARARHQARIHQSALYVIA